MLQESANKEMRKSYYKKKEVVWSDEEDKMLLELVQQYGKSSWRIISKYMQKSMIKCHTRFLFLTDQSEKASARWTEEQDKILRDFV